MAEQYPDSYYKTPFKFSGKEMDEETGLHYFGARYYDSRSSIWLSVDPLAEKYYRFNPYNYCLNNPLLYKDPDGKEIIIYYMDRGKERKFTYTYMKNRDLKKIPNNKFLRNSIKMIDKLVQKGATKDIMVSGDKIENCNDRILEIIASPKALSVIEVKDKKNVPSLYTGSTYVGDGKYDYSNNGLGTIKNNDEYGIEFLDVNGEKVTNSPTAQMGHEIIHQQHEQNEKSNYNNRREGHSSDVGGSPEEKLTTEESNQINVRLDEPLRTNYSGVGVPMADPTINKAN